MGLVGLTMSGTGESSLDSRLGLSGTGGSRENWEKLDICAFRAFLWYLEPDGVFLKVLYWFGSLQQQQRLIGSREKIER